MNKRYTEVMKEVLGWMKSKRLNTRTKIQIWNILKEEKEKNERVQKNRLQG